MAVSQPLNLLKDTTLIWFIRNLNTNYLIYFIDYQWVMFRGGTVGGHLHVANCSGLAQGIALTV
jgi:hypothetical protein